MKNIIFSVIWAAVCAWITVWLISMANSKTNFAEWSFIPAVVDAIHNFGWSAKKVLFFTLTAVYLFTGIHKLVGGGILFLLGCSYLLVVGLLILGGGWLLFSFLSSSL